MEYIVKIWPSFGPTYLRRVEAESKLEAEHICLRAADFPVVKDVEAYEADKIARVY